MSKGRIFVWLVFVMVPLGGWAGYHFSRTEFEVVGYVRVKPDTPVILYADAHDKMDPADFSSYLQLQVELIKSARVIDRAIQDPRWNSWKSPVPTDLADTLRRDLNVAASGDLIKACVSDPDKTLASNGAESILKAYIEITSETEVEGDSRRLELLEEYRTNCSNQLRAVREHIAAVTASNAVATTQSATSVGRQQVVLEEFNEEKASLQKRLDEVSHRIDALSLESPLGGRISVLSYGDPPVEQSFRRMRLRKVAAGAASGLVLAGLFSLMLGSSRRS